MFFNLHTHTVRCGHARGTEREFVEKAIAAGFTVFGFADHSPMPFPDGYRSNFRMALEETAGYVETLLALREEYRDDIKLLIGFEAEYYPAVFSDFLAHIAPFPVDYLIMGQHFVDNEIGVRHSAMGTSDEAQLKKYVDQCLEGLATGQFTYIAHPDVFRFDGPDEVYDEHMTRLCRGARELDIPLELNFLGLGDGRHYPSDRFFRLAAKEGCKVVYGLDAHGPERVGVPEVLEKAGAMAERLGLNVADSVPLRPVNARA